MRGASELRALLDHRTWDKEVALWLGSEKSLLDALAATRHVVLDLLDLFDVNNLPVDDDDTKGVLRDRLRQRLRSIPKGPDNRTVLVVKSISLLARYGLGLKEFFDWFIGSHTMVILLLEGVVEHPEWPDEVRCDAKRLLDYFQEPGMVKEVYTAQG